MAGYKMVVNITNRLQVGVANNGTKKLKAALLHIRAYSVGKRRARWYLRKFLKIVYYGLALR